MRFNASMLNGALIFLARVMEQGRPVAALQIRFVILRKDKTKDHFRENNKGKKVQTSNVLGATLRLIF